MWLNFQPFPSIWLSFTSHRALQLRHQSNMYSENPPNVLRVCGGFNNSVNWYSLSSCTGTEAKNRLLLSNRLDINLIWVVLPLCFCDSNYSFVTFTHTYKCFQMLKIILLSCSVLYCTSNQKLFKNMYKTDFKSDVKRVSWLTL